LGDIKPFPVSSTTTINILTYIKVSRVPEKLFLEWDYLLLWKKRKYVKPVVLINHIPITTKTQR
jgi:hypothetical protein